MLINQPTRNPAHQVTYLATRMYPCGGTRVIASHLNALKQAGCDVQLICNGMFAREAFDPGLVTEVRSFRDLEISAGTVVLTSFLVERMIRQSKIRCDLLLHFVQGQESEYTGDPQSRVRSWIQNQSAETAARGFFAPSAGLARQLRNQFPLRPVQVVWPFLDRQIFFPGTSSTRSSGRVLVIGNLAYQVKGLRFAAEALNQLDRNSLCIVRMANRPLQDDEIHDEFHENPPLAGIGAVYRSCDLLIYPSLEEGFGLPVLEAMSSGVPVITTNCAGMRGWVHDAYNAIVVPRANPDAIAEAVRRLNRNSDLRGQLIENGLRTASLFRQERTVRSLLKILAPDKGRPQHVSI